MKVFISGATGVLGRRVVKSLIAGGHSVVGLSRSLANTDQLKAQGAEPRGGNLFNQEQICELASDCDAILHLATSIPTKSRTTLADWAMNDRIRREGTQVMVEAALRNHCQLYVQESVTFIYGERKGEWVDERTSLASKPGRILQSAVDMEGIVQKAMRQRGLPAIILRYGSFYSHDSALTQSMFELARKGLFPIIGDGEAYWNNVSVDDAASAVVKAVENRSHGIGRTFNVCDDEPVTYRELVAFIAQTLKARKPMHIPIPVAKLMIGSHTVDFLDASVRCRNQSIKEALGWQPQYPNYRVGYPKEIEKWINPNSLPRG